MTQVRKNYDAIDLTKFICATLIIVLHTNPFPQYASVILPITHIAVPFFFIVGAFFCWKKLNVANTIKEKNTIIKVYIKGILKLYFIWFVITLPVTIYTRHFFSKGIIYGIVYFFRELLLHSTWRSSWYLMATVLGTIITYLICDVIKIRKELWGVITFIIYVICVLGSSYSGLLYSNAKIWSSYMKYVDIFTVPYTSFPVSLLWIFIGKIMAENEEKLRKRFSLKLSLFLLFICICLLLGEGQFVYANNLIRLTDDCYFTLVPLAIMIVSICICLDCNVEKASTLRRMSTLTYCMQGSLVELLGQGLTNCGVILFICYAGSLFIVYIQDRKKKNGIE